MEDSAAASGMKFGPGQGCRIHGGNADHEEWIIITKLGLLVKDMTIKSLGEIYLFFPAHQGI